MARLDIAAIIACFRRTREHPTVVGLYRISVVVLAVLAACGRSSTSTTPSAGPVDAGSACLGSPLRVHEESPGVVARVYVDLPIDGRAMPFFFDTGSEQTFRRLEPGSELVTKQTPTKLSCLDVGLAFSRGSVFAKTPDGHEVGGVIGTDLLLVGGVLDLRLRDSLFVWSKAAPALPATTVTLPATLVKSTDPYARSKIVVEGVSLDGKRSRLLFDTGSPHVVIVSNVPRPNEKEVDSFDGTGARVKFYESTMEVSYGGSAPRRVIVDRAASFPTLQKVFAAIGASEPGAGEIDGVLGMGALGHERIVISKDAVRFVL